MPGCEWSRFVGGGRRQVLLSGFFEKSLVADFLFAVELPVHLVQPLYYVPYLPLVYSHEAVPPCELVELLRYELQG